MVLVDFYQLAVLHKLFRCHAGSPTDRSYPGSMPTVTQTSPRSPSVEQDQPGAHFPLPTKPVPKTPKRNRDATQSFSHLTPTSRGTLMIRQLMHPMIRPPKLKSSKYEEYIIQDFERHRVFVDIDVFMKNVLHVPDDWKELWRQTIRDIKCDKTFSISYLDYCHECGIPGAEETRFYEPLVGMANAILDFSDEDSSDSSVKPRTPQRYLRNDPKRILYGVINDLSPDIVAVHKEFLADDGLGEPSGSNLTWAQPLQALEVKPWGGALVDGSCMPRLKVNGQDPQEKHADPSTPSRFPKEATTPATTGLAADNGAVSAPSLLPPRKRAANELLDCDQKTRKLHHESTPAGGGPQGKKPRRPGTGETDRQKAAYLQVGRYLLDQFSVPAFRSHATIALVDRDRIQFYHANHSVILVSSAISFSENDPNEGLDKFIAIVIAFGRLTLCDNGILHNLHDGKLFSDNERVVTRRVPQGAVQMQEGNELVFGGDQKTGPFTLTLGEVISHEPSLAGRSTAVLHAKSPKWKNTNLVVKISWPGSEREAEHEFLEEATSKARETAKDRWALKHLPRVLHAQDVIFGPDSTHEKVASAFDGGEIVNGEYRYERRILRIIIQERLHPLKKLTRVKDIAQVLLDVACVHRWLYEQVGILHRDLSPNNIMFRIVKRKVYGVLTDYDLASWAELLSSDYTKTSQQRTGTPPFMAFGLLDGSDALHLYRHDVESFFYIMVILATHYEVRSHRKGETGGVRMRQGEPPFELWFDEPSYEKLAFFKKGFLSNSRYLDLSPTFEDLRVWLLHLKASFTSGLQMKERHDFQQGMQQHLLVETTEQARDEVKPAAFDDETLGGYVTYSALILPARRSTGALKKLVIRYDPPPPLPPSSTGVARANA